MGLNSFLFAFASVCLLATTASVGGLFVLAAWLRVAGHNRATEADWRVPRSLYPFTISIVMPLTALICLGLLPDANKFGILKTVILFSASVATFASLIVSRARVRHDSEPGTRIVSIGSKLLFAFAIICFIGILAGLPGDIQTWKN